MILCPNCKHEFCKMPKGFAKDQIWGSWKLTGKSEVRRFSSGQTYKVMQCFCFNCNAEKWAQIMNLKQNPLCRYCYNGSQRGRNKRGFNKKDQLMKQMIK